MMPLLDTGTLRLGSCLSAPSPLGMHRQALNKHCQGRLALSAALRFVGLM